MPQEKVRSIALNTGENSAVPKRKRTASLKSKVIFLVTAVILTFGSAATLATFFLSQKMLIEVGKENLITSLSIQSRVTEQTFLQSQHLAKTIASQKNIIGLFTDAKEDDVSHVIEHGLLNDYNIGNMYSAIYLMDTSGVTILSTNETFVGKNYGFRNYFTKAMEGKPGFDIAVGVTSKKLGYYFSHPIFDDNNNIVGVAVVKLKPSVLQTVLNDNSKLFDRLYLADEYGVLVYTQEEKYLFNTFGQLSEKTKNEIKLSRRYENMNIVPIPYDIKLTSTDVINENRSKELIINDMDTKFLIAVSKVNSFPIYAVGALDLTQANEFAIRSALYLSLAIILSVVFSLVTIRSLLSKSLKPLNEISQAAHELSTGNLNFRTSIKTGDEFQILSESFNKVAKRMLEDQAILDKKVANQTKNLLLQQREADEIRKRTEKINSFMTNRELKMIELKKEIKVLKDLLKKNNRIKNPPSK